jgi:hypothetical protein
MEELPQPQHRDLETFRNEGFEQIEGWCSSSLFPICTLIDELQRTRDVKGGACEIGIHHGKFFLLLNQFVDADQTSYAVDLFDQQEFNIDYSGQGSLTTFRQNIAAFDRHEGKNIEIISADSTDGSLEQRIKPGAIRLFSVDGGHTAEHTISDLQLANRLIAPGGVVIMDDILNQGWLGVIEGVIKYLMQSPTLVPFAIGHNKLLMAKLSYYQAYFEAFQASELNTKIVHLLGRPIVAL